MALIAKQGGSDFQIAPAGQFAAICNKVIDCGHQYNETYGKWQPKVRIEWELHGDNQIGDGTGTMEGGKPFTIGAGFTLSLADNSNLRPLLEGWRGRPFTEEELEGFDISKLLGVPCMLTIQHETSKKGKSYAAVKQATPLLKSLTKPTQVSPSVLFDVEAWSQSVYESFPEWLRDEIKSSREFKERFGGGVQEPAAKPKAERPDDKPFDDEIPF